MATTLSYSFVKPQTGDKGSTFFTHLENNIQKTNDHTHDGSNTARLTAKSVTAVTDSILTASWAAYAAGGTGMYKQTVTMPTGMNFDDFAVSFRNAANDAVVYPTVVKASATTYDVIINDNTIALTVLYS